MSNETQMDVVEVPCPQCAPLLANNRADRRAAMKRARRCDFCNGSGHVTKNIPHSEREGGSADEQ